MNPIITCIGQLSRRNLFFFVNPRGLTTPIELLFRRSPNTDLPNDHVVSPLRRGPCRDSLIDPTSFETVDLVLTSCPKVDLGPQNLITLELLYHYFITYTLIVGSHQEDIRTRLGSLNTIPLMPCPFRQPLSTTEPYEGEDTIDVSVSTVDLH